MNRKMKPRLTKPTPNKHTFLFTTFQKEKKRKETEILNRQLIIADIIETINFLVFVELFDFLRWNIYSLYYLCELI